MVIPSFYLQFYGETMSKKRNQDFGIKEATMKWFSLLGSEEWKDRAREIPQRIAFSFIFYFLSHIYLVTHTI